MCGVSDEHGRFKGSSSRVVKSNPIQLYYPAHIGFLSESPRKLRVDFLDLDHYWGVTASVNYYFSGAMLMFS